MKKTCATLQIILLLWFFLDMIGVYFGDKCLVTQSYNEDGIFFLIYLASVLIFIVKDKIGKWIVAVWTILWFIVQFLYHELYTIFTVVGRIEGKIEYFSDTIKWLSVEGIYIPDLYHTVLHMLIITVIILDCIFIKKTRTKKKLYDGE